jgi:hypothetical protein
MARYISPYLEFAILTKPQNVNPPINDTEPTLLAKFYLGELIVGDPTTDSGPGNDLDWSKAFVVNPAGTNDKEKAGFGRYFFAAPYIDNTGSLTTDKVYVVVKGTVTHDSVDYTEGETFVATGASFTGTGIVALAVHPKNFPDIGFDPAVIWNQDLTPWYIVNQLGFTDASRDQFTWDRGNWKSKTKSGVNPWFYTS